MAAFGPETAAEGLLTITCLPRPRRTLVATLLTLPAGAAPSGDLVLRAGRRTFHAALTLKDDHVAEARVTAADGLIAALEAAGDLRVETPALPAAGIDTGRPTAALKRVLDACR